jgi:hypothetical protein
MNALQECMHASFRAENFDVRNNLHRHVTAPTTTFCGLRTENYRGGLQHSYGVSSGFNSITRVFTLVLPTRFSTFAMPQLLSSHPTQPLLHSPFVFAQDSRQQSLDLGSLGVYTFLLIIRQKIAIEI